MRALVQVVGTSPSLTVPNAEDPQLIEWYGEVSTFFGRLYPPSLMRPPPQHSLAILSSSHPDLRPNVKRKFKRLGPFTAIGECHLCAPGLDTKTLQPHRRPSIIQSNHDGIPGHQVVHSGPAEGVRSTRGGAVDCDIVDDNTYYRSIESSFAFVTCAARCSSSWLVASDAPTSTYTKCPTSRALGNVAGVLRPRSS